MTRLDAERKTLESIPPHERIIGFKGFTDTGIYLERAPNGTVAEYLLESGNPVSVAQRLAWCREAAEAVAWIHAHNVLHCDIQLTNLLLDRDLHVKLSDFQGKMLSEHGGEILLDGWSGEPCRFSCPREDTFYTDVRTDLFALGCTIYFIVMGHAIFRDIVDGEDGYYDKVAARLAKRAFPVDTKICGAVTMKCWEQRYESAAEVVRDLEAIEREHAPVVSLSVGSSA